VVTYEVSHVTRYRYDAPVMVSHAQIHQLPGNVDGQICLRRSVVTDPPPETYREHEDYFGNPTAVLSIHEPHTELVVRSSSVVDTTGRPQSFGRGGDLPWEAVHGLVEQDVVGVEFTLDSPLVARSERLAGMARPSFPPGRSLAEAVRDLTHRIHTDFVFDPGSTDVSTTLDEVLDGRRGVCQDFAHVLVGCLRSLGLAACYVSGYLETEPPPGQPRLQGADRTHAWVGVDLGEGEWVGVDPTNDQLAGVNYVTAARGRDYSDIPPLKGVIYSDSAATQLTVEVDVVPAEV
jgi:transglutaminase-like putative cysteine protease